jgi:hypothetical protein
MPVKRARLAAVTWPMRRRRPGDDLKLSGLAEALEVYQRIVEDAGAQDHRSWRSPARQRARAS